MLGDTKTLKQEKHYAARTKCKNDNAEPKKDRVSMWKEIGPKVGEIPTEIIRGRLEVCSR